MWGGIYMFLAAQFPFMYITTPEFGQQNFIYKLLYTNFAMDSVKARYYSAFKMCDAGAIASGYSYEGMVERNGK
jgi:hypothetical protein